MTQFLKAIGASSIHKSGKQFIYEGKGVFKPTATTFYMLHHLKQMNLDNQEVLDLGCGSGIIGLELSQFNAEIKKIFMSDVSLESIVVAKKNVVELNCKEKVSVKHGSLFLPWSNQKFDVIVNDVSGVSNLIPFYEDWFRDIPFETGPDGLALFSEFVSVCRNHLHSNGKVISALISLSNVKKAYSLINENGLRYEILGRYHWTRKIKDINELDRMENIKSQGAINFEIKDGEFQFYTEILEIGRIL